jgi:membrane protease YdiL (CAAX protease family)
MKPSYIGPFHPSLKLLILLALVIASFFIVFLFGTGIAMLIFGTDVLQDISLESSDLDPSSVAILKYFQIINQVGVFIVPALLFAWLNDKDVSGYLRMDFKVNIRFYILGILVIFTMLPLVSWLLEINGDLVLPRSLDALELWLRQMEEEAATITEAFLDTSSFVGFLYNLFIIALLASLAEEFLFRGVLVRLFTEWTKNVHLGVVIPALLFSALHLQFYGFLPRFLLGVVLGYLFVRSGTIWVPVLVHFVNNGMAVLLAFLSKRGLITTDIESFGATENVYLILGSLVVSFLIMIYIRILGKRQTSQ